MFRLVFALLFTTSPLLFAQIEGGTRYDVIYGKPTSLRQFGGPNVEILVHSKNISAVEFSIVDHEHEVVSAQTNISGVSVDSSGYATVTGENHVVFNPVTIRKAIRLGNGLEVAGTRSEAHLLHEVAGLKVYLLDALDTKQNECALLIVPKAPSQRENSGSLEDRLQKIKRLEDAGLISAAEAQKKHQEILGNL